MTTIMSKSSPVLDLETLWPQGSVVFRADVEHMAGEGFRQGDFIVVDMTQRQTGTGMAAISVDGGNPMVRRIGKAGPCFLRIWADTFHTDVEADRVRIIGRVVGLVRNYLE